MTASARQELVLGGCRAEPLLSYLKALGVLRLVATQIDPEARGRWLGDTFALTTTLNADQLVDFFQDSYAPSPILAPWNKDGGFLQVGTSNADAVRAVVDSPSHRFDRYRESAKAWFHVLDRLGFTNQDDLEPAHRKAELIDAGRGILPDDGVEWLDAVLAINDAREPRFAPLAGSGGNDGKLDFTGRFAGRIHRLLVADSANRRSTSIALLRHALLNDDDAAMHFDTVGMYDPAGSGGRNAGPDCETKSLVNPWDLVIGLEGLTGFSASVTRRLQAGSRAAFPFSVSQHSPAGLASATAAEAKSDKSRGETWLPMWSRPASWRETRSLIAEGRIQQGRSQSGDGVSVASAVKSLGVARGIDRFARTIFAARNGTAHFAVSAGYFDASEPDAATALLGDCDDWIAKYRREAHGIEAPRHVRAVRALGDAIFGLHRETDTGELGRARAVQDLLVALGEAEQTVAEAPKFRKDKRLRPLVLQDSGWTAAADDGSDEFAVAAALAAVDSGDGAPPMRTFWEPVALSKGRLAWTADDRTVVAKAGAPEKRFAAIFSRKSLISPESPSEESVRVHRSRGLSAVTADLSCVSAWLEGRLDADRVWRLFVGLSLIERPRALRRARRAVHADGPLPVDFAFAIFKLLAAPYAYSVERTDGSARLKLSPPTRDRRRPIFDGTLTTLIRNGALGQAFDRAVQRWRSYGLAVKGTRLKRAASASLVPPIVPSGFAQRLPAALMAPVSESSLRRLGALAFDLEGSDPGEPEAAAESASR